ncbi:Hpt domain-containing protein [Arvimicrobium flavum]|uniref:Hpt domain-containing protein n=1 Tax=Arvimicrobium flavum TaxID=3393320 RepID=UPI00237B51F0|nr:Hpt domain-containing protein [Mesorhizobium shangrilense]
MAPRIRPFDFAHLDRQTMGDRALEEEVLTLFIHQAGSIAEQIRQAHRRERLRLAHSLKGAARGVGAFAIADCLAELEQRPDDASLVERLQRLVDQAAEFVASVTR